MSIKRLLISFLILAVCAALPIFHADAYQNEAMSEQTFERERAEMVQNQIVARGVRDPKVLDAMRKVPRHAFVPEGMKYLSYYDGPLSIGEEQTISQPYIVALMTELLAIEPGDKILEIGTGSGYQAAVLSEITDSVYTIEILEPLYKRASNTLKKLGYKNIKMKLGDGSKGWPEYSPFDKIIVTAAALNDVPQPLIDQLKEGGIMVIPVGYVFQDLIVAIKQDGKLEKQSVIPVRFVPLVEKKD